MENLLSSSEPSLHLTFIVFAVAYDSESMAPSYGDV
jgi:hypothetical protein